MIRSFMFQLFLKVANIHEFFLIPHKRIKIMRRSIMYVRSLYYIICFQMFPQKQTWPVCCVVTKRFWTFGQVGLDLFFLLRTQKRISASTGFNTKSFDACCIEFVCPITNLFVRYTVIFRQFACTVSACELNNGVQFNTNNVMLSLLNSASTCSVV